MAAVRAQWRTVRILTAVTVAALLVAGCNDDNGGSGGATTTSGAVTTLTTVTGGSTLPDDTTPTTAGGGPSTSTPSAAGLVLKPDGLGLVSFGMTKIATLSALRDVLGPIDESGAGCEPAGPTANFIRWDELRLQFVGDQFDSYNVRPPNGVAPVLGLKTEEGIGLASTVAELEAAYGSRLAIPGLPPEFGGNDFAVSFPDTERKVLGSLSDTSAGGTVTGIFTQVCE
jgi:hypothetical protein